MDHDAPRSPASSEYPSQLARARTMLTTLGVLLDHHAKDEIEGQDERDFVAEIDALCAALGEAAICITRTL